MRKAGDRRGVRGDRREGHSYSEYDKTYQRASVDTENDTFMNYQIRYGTRCFYPTFGKGERVGGATLFNFINNERLKSMPFCSISSSVTV